MIFEIDETKNKLYEVLGANNYHYEIKNYYLHNDYISEFKYFYIRTTDDMIIDMRLSEFPEVFAVYEGFTKVANQEDIQRKITVTMLLKKEKPLIRSLLLMPIYNNYSIIMYKYKIFNNYFHGKNFIL